MNKITKNSIVINNNRLYLFRLSLNDIDGVIRLTKNNTKAKTLRITDRNVPITEDLKWQFHNMRTGYIEKPENKPYNFIGSFISRDTSKNQYLYWKTCIINTYRKLKGDNYA